MSQDLCVSLYCPHLLTSVSVMPARAICGACLLLDAVPCGGYLGLSSFQANQAITLGTICLTCTQCEQAAHYEERHRSCSRHYELASASQSGP